MEDFNFWWYIIAAVIYFLTRGKKKKGQPTRPGTENRPSPNQRPKSFEELLKEITEGTQEQSEPVKQEPVIIKEEKSKEELELDRERKRAKERRLEGERRTFADDESRRVYEESIKMAEGADLEFEADQHYRQESSLLKERKDDPTTRSFAEELMDGFDSDEAKKAIIYAEIMNRKY